MREPSRPVPPALTGSESIALTLAATAALIVVGAYLWDGAGFAFPPTATLMVSAGAGVLMLARLSRRAVWDRTETLTFAGIVTLTLGWLLWIARPTLFPLGSGPDLTHHLLLIRYIERHWRLVHDPAAQPFLGEMVQYTPGSHIITALAGAWSQSNGLHAVHTVMAASVAIKSGFVFLIAMRMLPVRRERVPLAAIASVSLFASQTYFLGSFAEFSFLAQVIAECFAVALWWVLVCWDQAQHRWLMPFAGLLGSAIFLTWPILIGPPLVVLGLLVLLPSASRFRERVVDAAIAAVPIVLVAALFSLGRMNYVVIAGAGGTVASPDVRAYGWGFLTLSTLGVLMATVDLTSGKRARTLPLMTAAILMQAAALFAFAHSRGNDPYMARKMFYLLLSAQGVGVAMAVARAWEWGSGKGEDDRLAQAGHYVPWMVLLFVLVLVGRPLIGAPKSLTVGNHPATSLELEQAGEWTIANADPRCVEYLVGDDNTAYWLHLALLGNPRRGDRTADNATYELNPALVRWLTPGGLPYAIADLRVIPADVRSSAEIVAQFGSAAVVKRQGPASCGEP